MINFITIKDYKYIIKECFNTDSEFLNKWHREFGKGLDACVDKTYNELVNLDVKFNALYEDGNLIGYFYKEDANGLLVLTGFFLKPEYRTKKYIEEFWNIVNKSFNNKSFFVGIYNINIPAINFIKRNGAIEVNKTSDFTLFRFNGDNKWL